MDLLALAIPLAAVFVLTNLCGLSFACSPCFALNTGACLLPLLASLGERRQKDGDQQRDDPNNNQKLHERECPSNLRKIDLC